MSESSISKPTLIPMRFENVNIDLRIKYLWKVFRTVYADIIQFAQCSRKDYDT